MAPPERPAWLTLEEIAEELRVHPRTVRRYVTQGDLVAVKLGRAYRVQREELEAWLRRRQT